MKEVLINLKVPFLVQYPIPRTTELASVLLIRTNFAKIRGELSFAVYKYIDFPTKHSKIPQESWYWSQGGSVSDKNQLSAKNIKFKKKMFHSKHILHKICIKMDLQLFRK